MILREAFEPTKEKVRNKKGSYDWIYLCPVCGEQVWRPGRKFLKETKPAIKECVFCEMKIDWSFLQKQEDTEE